MVKLKTILPFLLALSLGQPGFLQHTEVIFYFFSHLKPLFQGHKINFSNNGLWNRIIHELKSVEEVELKDQQMNFHVAELIDKVVKRGGNSFNQQSRKNGLRYFII